MDWEGEGGGGGGGWVLVSESIEEEEMSMLTAGFTARMRKRVVDSKCESVLISETSKAVFARCKGLERLGKNSGGLPDRAINDQLVLEGTPSAAGALLEEGIPIGGPSNVKEIEWGGGGGGGGGPPQG